jgi:hypothetical protein
MFALSSCLDTNDGNIPESASGSFIELIYNQDDATNTINSGVSYFANAALLLSAGEEKDTITFCKGCYRLSFVSR